MQMMLKQGAALLIFGFLGGSLMAKVAKFSSMKQRTPIEVWTVGDDGLTQKLRFSVEHKLEESHYFELSSGKRSGTLIITIPSNVQWKRHGERTLVLYRSEFSTVHNQILSSSKGSCFEDDLDRCAAQVVSDARKIRRKIR